MLVLHSSAPSQAFYVLLPLDDALDAMYRQQSQMVEFLLDVYLRSLVEFSLDLIDYSLDFGYARLPDLN